MTTLERKLLDILTEPLYVSNIATKMDAPYDQVDALVLDLFVAGKLARSETKPYSYWRKPAEWGWWGDEGGHRLDAKCWPDGKLELTVTTAHQPPSTVTLANFRALRLWQWINENTDLPRKD